MGRLIRSSEFDGANNLIQRIEQLYDKANRLEKQSWVIDGDSFSESYVYNDPTVGADASVRPQDGSLASVTTATGDTIAYTYDSLKRLGGTNVKDSNGNVMFRTGYSYKAGVATNQTTNRISVYTTWNPNYSNLLSYRYSYDALGNITKIEDVTNTARTLAEYTYDELNQLTQEKIYNYAPTNKAATPTSTDTYVYTYDTAGNILTEKKNGTVVNTYSYSTGPWADMLTKYNGMEITYDAVGNPTNYANWNARYGFTWNNGRILSEASVDGADRYDISYAYDADGIRTQKTVTPYGGTATVHNYVTQNGKVVRETIGTGATAKVLDFIYDNSGKPFALTYTNGTATPVTYYYVLNIQGDVIALMTADRTIVARYAYNAWGEILSATGTMAEINPIRYRGYYYDTETGFYYLQSRYYDPANHRFINADSYTSTGQGFLGCNMFAYCNNNPVNGIDPTGKVVSRIEFGNEVLLYDGVPTNTLPVYLPPPPLGLEEAVKAVGNCVADVATDVWNWTADVATDVWNWTADTATDAWNWTAGIVDETSRRLNNVDWNYVSKQTWITAVAGAGGGAATGALSGKLGAPFTAGASIPVCALAGGFLGGVGGAVEGFIQSFLEEFFE